MSFEISSVGVRALHSLKRQSSSRAAAEQQQSQQRQLTKTSSRTHKARAAGQRRFACVSSIKHLKSAPSSSSTGYFGLIQSASSTIDHRNASNIGRTYVSHHHGICTKLLRPLISTLGLARYLRSTAPDGIGGRQDAQDQSCGSASLCVRVIDQTPEKCSVQQQYWLFRFNSICIIYHRHSKRIQNRTYVRQPPLWYLHKASPSPHQYVRPGKVSQKHGPRRYWGQTDALGSLG